MMPVRRHSIGAAGADLRGPDHHGAATVNPRSLGAAVVAASLCACAGTGGLAPATLTLDSAGFALCPWPGEAPRVIDVHDEERFRAFLAQAELDVPRIAGWKPDFRRDRVVLVSPGPRSSAGYRAEWLDASLVGDRLRARVEVRPPASGEMAATVITHPCVAAWVRAPGATGVEVVDADSGEVMLRSVEAAR